MSNFVIVLCVALLASVANSHFFKYDPSSDLNHTENELNKVIVLLENVSTTISNKKDTVQQRISTEVNEVKSKTLTSFNSLEVGVNLMKINDCMKFYDEIDSTVSQFRKASVNLINFNHDSEITKLDEYAIEYGEIQEKIQNLKGRASLCEHDGVLRYKCRRNLKPEVDSIVQKFNDMNYDATKLISKIRETLTKNQSESDTFWEMKKAEFSSNMNTFVKKYEKCLKE